MDITIKCNSVFSSADYKQKVEVTLSGIEMDDIMDFVEVKDCIDKHGKDDFLDHIGIDYIKEYFGLTETE